jgi:hypothetical protein
MNPRLFTAVASMVFLLQFEATRATTLSLETGKSLDLLPSESGSITLSFTNNAGDITSNFLAWTLGIQVLPAGPVTNSITLGTLAQSVTNPMPIGGFPDIIQPTLTTLAGGGTINGLTNFYQIGMQTTVFPGTVLSDTSYNMGTLGITASAGASGTWNLYAIQQGGVNFQSFWANGSLADEDFANLPRGAGNSSILIGTINVVPEPGTLSLAALGLGFLLCAGLVRRRRIKAS